MDNGGVNPNSRLSRFDSSVPNHFSLVPSNKKIIDHICAVNDDEVLLVVVNIEGEQIGGDFKGLNLYTGRSAGALSGDGKHLLVVDNDIKDEITGNLNYLKTTKVIKDRPVNIIGINMHNQPYTFKALLKELHNEKKKGGTYLAEKLKKVSRILPFIHSHDMEHFLKEAKKLGHINVVPKSTYHGTEKVNNKGLTISTVLKSKGVCVPEGIVCKSKDKAVNAYEELSKKFGGELVLKKARSASGVGFYFVKNKDELIETIDREVSKQDFKKCIIIEQKLKNIVSFPGVVIDVQPGKQKGEQQITVIGVSDQLFLENNTNDAVVHMGNIWPIKDNHWTDEIWDAVKAYAEWIDESQAYGISGLDLAVCKEKGKLKPYALDPNCRTTGSVHPSLILHNIFGSARHDEIAWLSDNNFKVPVDMNLEKFVDFLRRNDLEFINENGKREGVIVANHATHINGKTQVIFVKSVEKELSNEAKQKSVINLWNKTKQLIKKEMS
jgi:hypothetical protein